MMSQAILLKLREQGRRFDQQGRRFDQHDADIKELKNDVRGLKDDVHRLGILYEALDRKISQVLEIVQSIVERLGSRAPIEKKPRQS